MYKASEGWNDHLFQVPPELLEKFAELIVQECIRIVARRKDQAVDDGCNVDEAMSVAEMDLEEHFGVNE
jgi:hypothetical protein